MGQLKHSIIRKEAINGKMGCFLSYSHKDEIIADIIINKLTIFGINVWRDREEIRNSKIITENENNNSFNSMFKFFRHSGKSRARSEAFQRHQWVLTPPWIPDLRSATPGMTVLQSIVSKNLNIG